MSGALLLDPSILGSVTSTVGFIATSIANYAGPFLIAGIGIWGTILVFKKIPGWVKTFAK